MASDGGANQIIADLFTKHAIDLLRVEAGQRKRIRALLTELEGDLVAQLAKIDPTSAVRSGARQARLEKLLAQVRDTIRASYRGASSQLIGELRELADIEAGFAARAINQGLGLELATATLTRAQASALVGEILVQGAPVADWWSRQAGDTLERFTDAMRLGIAQGDTSAQLIQRIRGGTRNGEQVLGFMDISRRNADSLVRSATQAVSQAARDTTYKANEDILKGIAWTATLDSRTTVECAARDGLLYTVEGKEPIDHNLPWGGGPGNLHWGCRSSSVPVTKSFRELGINIDDLPPGQRASIDGQVPADTKFEGWLSRQSKARQDEVLGPGRAELFREGKIGLRDMLDQNGRPLSMTELRERTTSPRMPRFMAREDAPHYERVLNRGRESNTEHLSAYDPTTGRQWTLAGSESHVSIPDAMLSEMMRGNARLVVHHNHPSSRSFSPQDFNMIGKSRGMKTLYAHAHDGSVFRADRVKAFGRKTLDRANNSVVAPFINFERQFSSPEDRMTLFHHVYSIWMDRKGFVKYEFELSGSVLSAYERNKALVDSIVGDF